LRHCWNPGGFGPIDSTAGSISGGIWRHFNGAATCPEGRRARLWTTSEVRIGIGDATPSPGRSPNPVPVGWGAWRPPFESLSERSPAALVRPEVEIAFARKPADIPCDMWERATAVGIWTVGRGAYFSTHSLATAEGLGCSCPEPDPQPRFGEDEDDEYGFDGTA